MKNEAETHKKIAETYEETVVEKLSLKRCEALNRLKVEHSEAEKEYQAQEKTETF